ncbi:MAG: hypothetical protein ACRD3O_00665 [Terriglobia bacterium]
MPNFEFYGTPKSHYASSKVGPFKCATCAHLSFPHFCNHPEVIADASQNAGELRLDHGKAAVHLAGCCNEWRPRYD